MQSLNNLIIDSRQSIRDALVAIDINGHGVCFVTESEVLVGVATDGDIRRALLSDVSLECSIEEVMNKDFVSLSVNSDEKIIRQSFAASIKVIPLCDDSGRVVDIADVLRSHRIPVLEPELSGKEIEYVQDCINTNWISSQGSYVRKFEEIFNELHQGMHSLAVSNGTAALHLALVALGVSEGDEVIVPDLTFAASVNAILYCNATPVLCEIDSSTWCIDIEEVKKLITPRTKAILPVHLYGQVCNMDSLRDIALEFGLFMIEDCAEAIGSKWNNIPVGVFGEAAIFSFFGNKLISTGEGGMVLFKDQKIADKARILRDHGMSPGRRYWHETVGFNYRMTNLQAAIGVAQMERFEEFVHKKREIAEYYDKMLEGVDGVDKLPADVNSVFHSQWLYTIVLSDDIERDTIIELLRRHGVDTRPVFCSMHLMPPYQEMCRSVSLKNSIAVSKNGISLPSSVRLSIEDVEYVSEIVMESLRKERNNKNFEP